LTPALIGRGSLVFYAIRFPQKTCEQAPVAATLRQIHHRNGRLFPPDYLRDSWLDYLYWDTELDL
jgi:hypothetical protein